MDTKRLILAVALSIVVIMVYQYFFMPKPVQRQVPHNTDMAGQETAQPAANQENANNDGTGAGTETKTGADDSVIILDDEPKKEVKEDSPEVVVEENLEASVAQDIKVETDLFTAVFTNQGAGLKSFIFKKYNDDKKEPMDLISTKVNDKFGYKVDGEIKSYSIYPFFFAPFKGNQTLVDPLILHELNNKKFVYKGEEVINLMGTQDEMRELVFQYADVEKKINVNKRFTIVNNSYLVNISYEVVIDGQVLDLPILFGPDLENNVSEKRVMQGGLRVAGWNGEDVEDKSFATIDINMEGKSSGWQNGILGSGYYWGSLDTNYFTIMFKNNKLYRNIAYHVVKKKTGEKEEKLYSYVLATKPESIYMGPKDERILLTLEENHGYFSPTKVVDYGWSFFGDIAKLLLKGILFVQGFVPNVGWALVIFTIFIKILLFPLSYSSYKSMAKMQTLQPKMKAIKKKYKNLKDPEQRKQMNVETMALYKQEKVNPAGGCLPMILQMPILFAFFRLLPISINFRHEPWMLWLTDLSIKDPFYVLPILMGATQILVTHMSPTTGDSSQKKMMYIMPVVMVFLFMNYSAGLNLYWFVSNLLQVVQQYFINRLTFAEKKEEDRQKRAQKRKKGGKK
jgi:YidC/Oxa1 family membrane protein insertase